MGGPGTVRGRINGGPDASPRIISQWAGVAAGAAMGEQRVVEGGRASEECWVLIFAVALHVLADRTRVCGRMEVLEAAGWQQQETSRARLGGRPVTGVLRDSPTAARRLMQSKGEVAARSVLALAVAGLRCLVLVISFGLARFENRGDAVPAA